MGAEDFKKVPIPNEQDTVAKAGRRLLARQAKFALRDLLASLMLPLAKIRNLGGAFITVLAYHRLLPDFPPGSPRTGCVDPAAFAAQLEFLIRNGYDILSLDGLRQVLTGEVEPPRQAVAITFDDGYADNCLVAHKIALEYEAPINFFLPTGIIGQPTWPCDWAPRTPQEEAHMGQYPALWRPLTWEEVRAMKKKGGAFFGCHGYRHRRLAKLSPAELEEEIDRSASTFEMHLGYPPRDFSIPWGEPASYTPRAVEVIKAHGFQTIFTATPRRIRLPFKGVLLPRIQVRENDSLGAFSRKIQGAHDLLHRLFHPFGGRA